MPPFQEPTHQSSPVWQSFRNSEASFECSLGMCLTTYPSDLSHAWRPRFWEKTTGKELLKKITQSPRLQTIKADKILGNHMLSVFPFKNSGHNLLSISQVLPVPSRLTSGIRHHLAHSEEGRSSRSPTKATGQNRQSWQCGTADCTEKTS